MYSQLLNPYVQKLLVTQILFSILNILKENECKNGTLKIYCKRCERKWESSSWKKILGSKNGLNGLEYKNL